MILFSNYSTYQLHKNITVKTYHTKLLFCLVNHFVYQQSCIKKYSVKKALLFGQGFILLLTIKNRVPVRFPIRYLRPPKHDHNVRR